VYLDRGLLHPNRRAVVDPRGAWTYGELDTAVGRAAAALGSLGGQRIGLLIGRGKEAVAAFLAVLEAGGVAVPFSTRASPREIAYQAADAGVSRIVTEPGAESLLSEAGACPRLALSDLHADGRRPPLPAADSPALMMYTSGTTGRPKGVVHTHASLMAQVDVLHRAWGWSEDDRLLHVLPLHHVHGLVNGVLGALWAGAELQMRKGFDASETWAAFAAREPTVFYAVPTLYHQLAEAWERQDGPTRKNWSQGAGALRLAVSGSAALPPTLWTKWRDLSGQALLERYGMTEIGMAISNPYRGERRPGTVGQPLPGVEIRLTGEGEIWMKGPTLYKEYWNRPDATRESFQDGYFRTGDVAEIRDGYYIIRGRMSVDIIKSAGYKISALEIEGVVAEHPSVREAAVVGVPDPEWGEVVTACVIPRAGASLTLEDLRAFCQDKLASYKTPRRLAVLPELPRNAMGKVTKPELVRRLESKS
jgi:malonyl-CoA/methylmalonyl-CoA synthetase